MSSFKGGRENKSSGISQLVPHTLRHYHVDILYMSMACYVCMYYMVSYFYSFSPEITMGKEVQSLERENGNDGEGIKFYDSFFLLVSFPSFLS